MRLSLASKVCLFLALASIPLAVSLASAEDETFYCEVLSVEGTVLLNNSEIYGKAVKEGDLLKVDDEIETAEGGTADLAFDKDWSNVTRVEEKSRVKVKAVFPTRLYLDKGALYAKLKSLPRDSVFQVETPTAIAAVRGTEYRTEYAEGETSISNDSEAETSKVYLYEPDEGGQLRGEPTVLPRAQFAGVSAGAKPRSPQPMSAAQQQRCQKARGVLDHKIQESVSRGRVSKIQDIHKMEAFGQKMKERETAQRQKERARHEENRNTGGPNDPPGGAGHQNNNIQNQENGEHRGDGNFNPQQPTQGELDGQSKPGFQGMRPGGENAESHSDGNFDQQQHMQNEQGANHQNKPNENHPHQQQQNQSNQTHQNRPNQSHPNPQNVNENHRQQGNQRRPAAPRPAQRKNT